MERFKNLLIDIFADPKVGWYSLDKNISAANGIMRNTGVYFPEHLVERYDPNKVRDILSAGYQDPWEYKKVNIPPRSKLLESGWRYRVAPKNIIPYSPENKSLAYMLAKKYGKEAIKYGGKFLGKTAVPLMIIDGLGFNNPAE